MTDEAEHGPWVCGGCEQTTEVSHWAEGTDGKMHHVPLLTSLLTQEEIRRSVEQLKMGDILGDDEYPPEVDYPDGHGPMCPRSCDHPCHHPYDAWAARVEARCREALLEHPDLQDQMEP